ncbi:MAG: hypothetical protein OEZ39_00255 [Gammaproteobacteria bacterium]|nr:hypothetical protein [Gammaproteobacteria bacterium]MDH5650279.1 hypothetical protein [Gammaproteobacteria bacterium]
MDENRKNHPAATTLGNLIEAGIDSVLIIGLTLALIEGYSSPIITIFGLEFSNTAKIMLLISGIVMLCGFIGVVFVDITKWFNMKIYTPQRRDLYYLRFIGPLIVIAIFHLGFALLATFIL